MCQCGSARTKKSFIDDVVNKFSQIHTLESSYLIKTFDRGNIFYWFYITVAKLQDISIATSSVEYCLSSLLFLIGQWSTISVKHPIFKNSLNRSEKQIVKQRYVIIRSRQTGLQRLRKPTRVFVLFCLIFNASCASTKIAKNNALQWFPFIPASDFLPASERSPSRSSTSPTFREIS